MEHIPVLFKEVISNLNIKPNGNYVDLTIGRAGHSKAILAKLTTGHLYGFDQDQEAIDGSNKVLSEINNNFTLYHENFRNMFTVLETEELVGKIDGILIDLGVSSPQFDNKDRGFSYREDAPLDMRMDQRQGLTAYEVVNTYSYEALNKIFRDYGDERFAKVIAKNIIKSRPIKSTFELVDIIKKSKPSKELRKEGHPAKQVFQAIRIEVNDELNALKEVLDEATKVLAPNGRLLIISFHSGEDKIVKSYFRDLCIEEGTRVNIPTVGKKIEFNLITHKPIVASEEELAYNNRSHSAKLRIIEKKGE